MKNQNISNLDLHQMQMRSFDESNDANRVIIVGQEFNIDQEKMAQALKEGMSSLKIEIPQQQPLATMKEVDVKVVEVPKIIEKEVIKIVEVKVPTIETKIERVEIPVVVPKVEIIQVEKPVIVKEIIIKEIHSNDGIRKLQIALLALNLLAMLIAIFKH